LAIYAFENLRNEQLEPTIKRCLENMEIGAIILLKDPYPNDKNKVEFVAESQRYMRPKKIYRDLLMKYGCSKLRETTFPYRYSQQFRGEYVLIYQKERDVDENELKQVQLLTKK
jgi:hypothetical protein